MSDALISPAVGAAMWAVSGAAVCYSAAKTRGMEERRIPLMGVMGAFVFAAQMINFAIPGTGSSGHIGGGVLLSVILGPHAGFLVITCVLVIQALFFADGGLLALGCNIFNMGFFPCFIAYPLIYKVIAGKNPSPRRIFAGSVAAAVIGLQLGALGVTAETFLSGRVELPFGTFVLLMLPVHLAIGVIEGLVTGAALSFVWKVKPELIAAEAAAGWPLKRLAVCVGMAALVCACVFSLLASSCPDGLEWSIEKISGKTELEAPPGLHETIAQIQDKTSFLPDYSFGGGKEKEHAAADAPAPSIAGKVQTSVAGLVGGVMVLFCAGAAGAGLRYASRKKS
jgi:cobalt/nickel transport system permease protein